MKIHFIGIGGIGVSALANYYIEKGAVVSGSDLVGSEITNSLQQKGASIYIGKHKKKNLPDDVNLVVYSPAVKEDNPEFQKARKLEQETNNLRLISYPEALGELTNKYYTIAVAGTHGKSTTTAMIGLILEKGGLNPTVIVGTKVKEFNNSNCRVGNSKYLVIEADEHFASFLNYSPNITILTNIERDHLDYYKNLDNIISSFKNFISNLKTDGWLVANEDDKNINKLLSNSKEKINKSINIKRYSLSQKEANKIKQILQVPGEHNVSNALGALEVAKILKIDDKESFKALSEYKGAWRRFQSYQVEYKNKNITLVSDYAHHPTEVKKTIKAAKEKFPESKIWAVFQPHQVLRTFYLFDDFAKAFDVADEVIITKIYAVSGREDKQISQKVSGKKLANAIEKRGKPSHFVTDFNKIPKIIKKELKSGDVVLIMGAGDIYKIVEAFKPE